MSEIERRLTLWLARGVDFTWDELHALGDTAWRPVQTVEMTGEWL